MEIGKVEYDTPQITYTEPASPTKDSGGLTLITSKMLGGKLTHGQINFIFICLSIISLMISAYLFFYYEKRDTPNNARYNSALDTM